MNRKICDVLFGLIVFGMIFNTIPQTVRLNFLGGPLARQLMLYPLLAGLLYTAYCQWKYHNVFIYWRIFCKFILAYVSITLISTIWGLYTYPYYEAVLHGPINQIEKLPYVLNLLHDHGIWIDEKWLTAVWMMARAIKTVLLETLYTWGGVYMIFCWYIGHEQELKRVLLKGIFASLCVVIGYSIIEISYFNGNDMAQSILQIINPYFYDIKVNHDWWPPLLWEGQLRSVFPEPSNFSMWAAFVLPFLIYAFCTNMKRKWLVQSVLIILCGMIFLTNSRTGVALLVGEFVLFFIYVIYARSIALYKKGAILFLTVLISFGISFCFDGTQNGNTVVSDNRVEMYIEKNLSSLSSVSQRSNRSRYGGILADINIGLQHPVLGVGKGLAPAYRESNFPECALKGKEVQKRTLDQR